MKRLMNAGVLLALPAALITAGSARAATPRIDAPVVFNFNPADVPKYDAVVVTVCGLDFSDLEKAILDRLFAKDEGKVATATPRLDKLAPNKTSPANSDNTYLEDALSGMLAKAGKHYLVVPLPWTRDPEKTDAAEAQFATWLPQVYAAAAANKKPLYVFAHSWGTMLTHDVLVSLAAHGSPVHVDAYVTVGSPLMPSDGLIKLFDGMELPSQDFGALAAKPANVAVWRNFWGKRDLFSNSIPAADVNSRVDGGADHDDTLLDIAVLDPFLTAQALKDLAIMNDLSLWHASYYAGYDQSFPSIKSQLDLDIPDAQVMPNAF